MQNHPLMPKATAIWLVENTYLTFEQIATFCGLHLLEVKSIADDEYGVKIKGLDPVVSGQLTREEIERCQKDPKAKLLMAAQPELNVKIKGKRKKYTPLSKRQDKPEAINWLLKQYPEMTDAQIIKLIGTTKSTISSIRDKTHWNIKEMRALDPVIGGLCSQTELDSITSKLLRAREMAAAADEVHGRGKGLVLENISGRTDEA